MWDGIFSEDNPFFKLMNRIADMIVLNVLFLLSCIPIVTVGPALTALYYVAINAWSRDDGYIFQMYKKSFKENCRQSVLMWLLLLAVGIILSVDVWYWVSQWKLTGVTGYKPLIVISVALLVLYVLIFTYVWPLQAKFSNSIKGIIKNAFAMAITHVPETLGIWFIFGAAAFAVYMVNMARVCVFVIGFSLVAYMQALIFRHVFKPYMGKDEHKTPEEEAELAGYENSYADAKIQAAEMEEQNTEKETGREADMQAKGKPSIKDIITATSNQEEEDREDEN